jgi:hypothetical protein
MRSPEGGPNRLHQHSVANGETEREQDGSKKRERTEKKKKHRTGKQHKKVEK